MTPRLRTITRSLAFVAGGVALAGCGLAGPASVSAADVEEQITEQLTQMVGQAPDDVTCPDDLPAEEGAEMTCVLSAGGETIDVAVTVTSVDGDDVNFDIQVADAANE
jgi:predicted small lipoprotein YifL